MILTHGRLGIDHHLLVTFKSWWLLHHLMRLIRLILILTNLSDVLSHLLLLVRD